MNPYMKMLEVGEQSTLFGAKTISGRLTSKDVYGSGWCRGLFRVSDEDEYVSVVGEHLNGIAEGGDYRLTGKFERHPKFGVQFQVTGSSIELEPSAEAIARHLRRNFKGVGEATSHKIVVNFCEDGTLHELRDKLVNNPFSLDLQKILKKKNPVKMEAKEGTDDGPAMYVYRQFSVRLQGANIRDGVLKKLSKHLFERCSESPDPIEACWKMFSEDPYDPIKHVSGYGFSQADLLGHKLGIPKDAECRLAALAIHSLQEGCDTNGHTFLTLDDFKKSIKRIDEAANAENAIAAAVKRAWPMKTEGDRYYPNDLYYAEVTVAQRLADRSKMVFQPIFRDSSEMAMVQIGLAERSMGEKFKLDPSQKNALHSILTSRCGLHTLTAGPGCGKTAIMELLTDIIQGKRKVLFAAPTGKASRVLGKRIQRFGIQAMTIHSMLGPNGEGFTFDSSNPLKCDVLILDESSMIDIELFRAVLEALPDHAHLILLGDVGQLPSVGPGKVLADVMSLPGDHHRLNTTHRNDGGILDIVRQAGAGKLDCVDRADVRFSHHLMEPDGPGMDKVINTYLNCVKTNGEAGVGMLLSKRVGDVNTPGWNTTYMNHALRQKMNPNGEKVPGTRLTTGDRVLIRKNMVLPQGEVDGKEVNERVVNGDTGKILAFVLKEKSRSEVSHVFLKLDDGRELKFPGGESLGALDLGYALTVHVSQGSEFKDVIFVCVNGPPSFVHRASAYTAFSRAKSRLVIIGDDDVLRNVVQRGLPKRNSALQERYMAKEAEDSYA